MLFNLLINMYFQYIELNDYLQVCFIFNKIYVNVLFVMYFIYYKRLKKVLERILEYSKIGVNMIDRIRSNNVICLFVIVVIDNDLQGSEEGNYFLWLRNK